MKTRFDHTTPDTTGGLGTNTGSGLLSFLATSTQTNAAVGTIRHNATIRTTVDLRRRVLSCATAAIARGSA